MVSWTPTTIRPSILRVLLLLATFLLIPNGLLFVVLRSIWEPISYVAFATCALTIWKCGPRIKKYWIRRLEELLLEQLRSKISRFDGQSGYTHQVAGIKVGAWARLKDEYEVIRKAHRRQSVRSASDPLVSYQLVVATLRAGGNRQKVAFSDGSAHDWHPTTSVIQHNFMHSPSGKAEYCTTDETGRVSRALVDMVRISGCNTNGISLQALATSCGLARNQTLLRAVYVGSMWGLLCTDWNTSVVKLYQMARDSDAPLSDLLDSCILRPTDAGRVWQECSEEARITREAADQRRSRMSQPRPQKVIINNASGNVNVAGGHFYGQTSNFHGRPPSEEILNALEVVLKRTDIPWMSADLVHVHAPIERSVRQRDTTDSTLRPAVAKLVQVCETLGLGVASSALFEVLKGFVT